MGRRRCGGNAAASGCLLLGVLGADRAQQLISAALADPGRDLTGVQPGAGGALVGDQLHGPDCGCPAAAGRRSLRWCGGRVRAAGPDDRRRGGVAFCAAVLDGRGAVGAAGRCGPRLLPLLVMPFWCQKRADGASKASPAGL